MKTTVQIKSNTLKRLKEHKKHPRQSYDELINELIDESDAEELTEEEIEDLKEALDDVKEGRLHALEEVERELGITPK